MFMKKIFLLTAFCIVSIICIQPAEAKSIDAGNRNKPPHMQYQFDNHNKFNHHNKHYGGNKIMIHNPPQPPQKRMVRHHHKRHHYVGFWGLNSLFSAHIFL